MRAHREPRPRRGPQHRRRARPRRRCSPSPTPTTWCRPRRTPRWRARCGGRGVDLATGSIVRWEDDALVEPPWMRRLHHERRTVRDRGAPRGARRRVRVEQALPRSTSGTPTGLSWPEGVRYEDQPTTTRAFLAARRFAVLPEVVYHWRIRTDGSSITQQRSSIAGPARPVGAPSRCRCASVEAHGSAEVTEVFRDRVLAGDLHRYFTEIPGCADEWWALLRDGRRGPVGRPLAGALRAAPGAPADRVAGRAGPARATPRP